MAKLMESLGTLVTSTFLNVTTLLSSCKISSRRGRLVESIQGVRRFLRNDRMGSGMKLLVH